MGEFEVKSNEINLLGGENIALENLPKLPKTHSLRFVFKNDDNVPYSHMTYIATNKSTGETFKGTTDEKGYTEYFYTDHPEEFDIHLDI